MVVDLKEYIQVISIPTCDLASDLGNVSAKNRAHETAYRLEYTTGYQIFDLTV